MAQSEILSIFIKSWEGGYVNHPNDKGGPTNMGITIATFRSVYGQGKSVQDLKNMTDYQWWYIFKRLFWDKCKGDQIESQAVANLIVDWTWASGVAGIKLAQGVLGVTQDGVVGPKTLAALNLNDTSTVFAALWRRRKQHFEALAKKPGQSVFLKGWLNRLNGIKYDRLLCNTYRKYLGKRQQKVVTWQDDILAERWEDVK